MSNTPWVHLPLLTLCLAISLCQLACNPQITLQPGEPMTPPTADTVLSATVMPAQTARPTRTRQTPVLPPIGTPWEGHQVLETSNRNHILFATWTTSTTLVFAQEDGSHYSWSSYDVTSRSITTGVRSPLPSPEIYTRLGVPNPSTRYSIPGLSSELIGVISPSGEKALTWEAPGDCFAPGAKTTITVLHVGQPELNRTASVGYCVLITEVAWSSDEAAVVLGLGSDGGIGLWRWDLSSAQFEPIRTASGEEVYTDSGWSFSRLTSRLAVVRVDRELQLFDPFEPVSATLVLSLDARGVPAFSQDSRHLYFWEEDPASGDTPRVMRYDLETQSLEQVARLDLKWEPETYGLRSLAVSPDGRFLALFGFGLTLQELP